MHKVKNIYFVLIKKKRDAPRQGVAQRKIPFPTSKLVHLYKENSSQIRGNISIFVRK